MENFINLIFPEKHICFICGEYGEDIGSNICSICSEKLIFTKPFRCSICGRKLKEPHREEKILRCNDCIKYFHHFTKNVAPISYEGEIKQWIYDFKYKNQPHMHKLFAKFMVKSIIENDLENVDMVVPVPLHRDRMKKRGYNQSELLAKYIAKELKLKIDTKNLVRKSHTVAQNKLSRDERVKNISEVFEIKDKKAFAQKRILVVDDIYTTGSTIDECSKILLTAGAKNIFSATISVTPNDN